MHLPAETGNLPVCEPGRGDRVLASRDRRPARWLEQGEVTMHLPAVCLLEQVTCSFVQL